MKIEFHHLRILNELNSKKRYFQVIKEDFKEIENIEKRQDEIIADFLKTRIE